MRQKSKGSTPTEQYVSIAEAARMLGYTVDTLHAYHRRGILEAVYPTPGGGKHFRAHDLSAFAEAKERKVNLASVAEMAMQAYVISRANEKRLADLYDAIGLDIPELGVTEEEVVSLYLRAETAKRMPPREDAAVIREWARSFYAMNESYLELVSQYAATDEPWKLFLDLGRELLVNAPRDSFLLNPTLQSAYGYLRISFNNLRSVSYFFCRSRHGSKTADELFDGPRDAISNVCRLLFPDLRGVSGPR